MQKNSDNILKHLVVLFKGSVMGVAQVIPGVSGGTLALIMGIYQRFIRVINEISHFMVAILGYVLRREGAREKIKDDFKAVEWAFVIVLMLGMTIAILFASGIITSLLSNYKSQTYAVFFGLIIGSVAVPWRQMEKKRIIELAVGVVAFISLFLISGIETSGKIKSTIITTSIPIFIHMSPSLVFVFFSGAISISAMILPGLSGSFVMLILGLYGYIMNLIHLIKGGNLSSETILPLAVFAVGLGVGIFFFAKFLEFLLDKYHSLTMSFLIGLMFGSLRKIFPFTEGQALFSSAGLSILLFIVVGFILVFSIDKLSKKTID